MCTGDNNSVNTDHGDEKIFCLYTNYISILVYWVSSVPFESCNKKGNIHGKSRLFPTGFSQGIQWARRVSQGPEELSLNTWIAFNTLWNINPYCFTQLISSVANLCESFSDRFLAPRLLIDAVAVRLCKSVF